MFMLKKIFFVVVFFRFNCYRYCNIRLCFVFFFIKKDYFMFMLLLSRSDIEIKYSWYYDIFIWI